MRNIIGATVLAVIILLATAAVISREINRPVVRIIDLDGNSLSFSVNGHLKVSSFNSNIEARDFAEYLGIIGTGGK